MRHGPDMKDMLLVTPDMDFEAQVKRAFDGDVEAGCWWDADARLRPEEAVDAIAAYGPAVVVLGPGLRIPECLELASVFDSAHPEICVVLVAEPADHLFEQALRSGVRDIITPGDGDEAVHEILQRARATAAGRRQVGSPNVATPEVPKGRVITVMSPKGGAGKTTVASNLAVRLAATSPDRVALVDLDLQFGDAGSALGLTAQWTIADAARATDRLDSTSVKALLEPSPAGVYLLAAPHLPGEADDIDVGAVGHMIDILASEFDYVIVDTAPGLDEHGLTAAERCDDLVLVCATDVPSVRGLGKALNALNMLGMSGQRRHLVLNRANARVGCSQKDVETTLGVSFDAAIPSSRSVPISTNQGSPVIDSEPRSPVAKALMQFADRFSRVAPLPQAASSRWVSGRRAS